MTINIYTDSYTAQSGWKVAVIDNNPRPPTKEESRKWFLSRLIANIDDPALTKELVEAVEMGHLTQKNVDDMINKAIAERARIQHDNITRLLEGTTNNNMQYNYGSGEYEPKPPFGWGQ